MAKKKEDYALASDGLIARVSGTWAKQKLSYLDDYVPPALKATERKWQRHYVDLFAGPGLNIDRKTGEEFPGSPLRALTLTAPGDARLRFTHASLVNKNPACNAALETRIARGIGANTIQLPKGHVVQLCDDANRVVFRILNDIDPQAYALVVADIERPRHWPWSTVRALHSMGHRSIDLYLLFPLYMAINRMIAYEKDATQSSAQALTTFFGTEDWRSIADERITDVQSPRLRQRILQLYVGRLRGEGWAHVKVVRHVKRTGRHLLYQMLFATNHPAGNRISDWSAGQSDEKEAQRGLFD